MRKAIERANTIIGKGFADDLSEVILEIGSDKFTKLEVIEQLGCGNLSAARRITRLLKKTFVLQGTRHLYEMTPGDILRIRGVGAASMWVLMCALDYKGFNIERWWKWETKKNIKFSSYRHRVLTQAKKRR